MNAINKLERPNYLCREMKSNQAILPSYCKQNLQGNEKSHLELVKKGLKKFHLICSSV